MTLEQLNDGDNWQRIAEVMHPIIVKKANHYLDNDESADELAHEILLALIATIPTIDLAPPPESDKS